MSLKDTGPQHVISFLSIQYVGTGLTLSWDPLEWSPGTWAVLLVVGLWGTFSLLRPVRSMTTEPPCRDAVALLLVRGLMDKSVRVDDRICRIAGVGAGT